MLTKYTVRHVDGVREQLLREAGNYLWAGTLRTPSGWRTMTLQHTRRGVDRAADRLNMPLCARKVWAEPGDKRPWVTTRTAPMTERTTEKGRRAG